MKEFNWKAMDTKGVERTGKIRAKTREQANTLLKSQGLFPISVMKVKALESSDEAQDLAEMTIKVLEFTIFGFTITITRKKKGKNFSK
jgi:type II secretory pathway component PulF